jgi:hypothetical protein
LPLASRRDGVSFTTDLQTRLREDAGSLAVIATVVAAVSWFASATPGPATQFASALLSGVVAFLAAAVGLALLRE